MGVQYSDFGSLNPRKLKPFINAYQRNQEVDRDKINLSAWLVGMYVMEARAATPPLGKGKHKYPKEPIQIFSDNKIDENKKADIDKVASASFAMLAHEMSKFLPQKAGEAPHGD